MTSAAGSARKLPVIRNSSVVTAALMMKKLYVTTWNICGRVSARWTGWRTSWSTSAPRSLLDAGHDRGGAEQDEAADDHRCTETPVHAAGQHQEPDRCDRHHGNGRSDIPQKRSLEPAERSDDRPRSLRVGDGLRVSGCRSGKCGQGRKADDRTHELLNLAGMVGKAAHDGRDISLGLADLGHTAGALDPPRTGVVGGERLLQVAAETI